MANRICIGNHSSNGQGLYVSKPGKDASSATGNDLIFDMEEMVSYISQYFTLEPGDMIWSGTMGSTRAMVPGDVYEVELSGVGVLSNEVVQGK